MTRGAAAAWAVYGAATGLLEMAGPAFLRWRLKHGKEDPARLGERLGRAGKRRPDGPLVWLHGASVGEGLSLLPLIAKLQATGLRVLLTSGTVTSAALLPKRLPAGVLHQFVPLDGPRATARFLDHWRPSLILFAESELWPNLLGSARRRGIPVALINARLSARSFGRWSRLPGVARALLGGLDLILAQSPADAERYAVLSGHPVASTGTLKYDAAPPPADSEALAALRADVAGRPVWLAASTHTGEDLACCAIHARLGASLPRLLTIVVPRHIDRGPAILSEASRLGLRAGSRSANPRIGPEQDIHVADTMGELGLFYRLGTAVFVGKTLMGGGGQNPIEPAMLGNAILHGPLVANFMDVFADLDRAGGGACVATTDMLGDAVAKLLTEPSSCAGAADAAQRAVAAKTGATARTMAALAPFLPRPAAATRE